MTNITLMTLDEAKEFVRQAVETQGEDFVYCRTPFPDIRFSRELTNAELAAATERSKCYYLPQPHLPESDPRSRTGCIVGVAMRLAGREVTEDVENETPDGLADVWVLTEEAANYLRDVQRVQDEGRTWGEAAEVGNLRIYTKSE